MNYFQGLLTVENIKGQYRTLAFKHHPDHGGDLETMKTINAQYHAALKACNGQKAEGVKFAYRYDKDIEQGVMEQLHSLIAEDLKSCRIALIGTWIWVTGDTKPHKDIFKRLGMKYSGEKQSWYWHQGKYRRHGAKGGSFGSMASKYGYREFSDKDRRTGISQ